MQEGVKRRGKDRWQMPLKRWRLLAVTAAVLILSGLAAGCGTAGIRKKQKPFDVQYLTYFDTVTSITIYADDEEQFDEWEQLGVYGLHRRCRLLVQLLFAPANSSQEDNGFLKLVLSRC